MKLKFWGNTIVLVLIVLTLVNQGYALSGQILPAKFTSSKMEGIISRLDPALRQKLNNMALSLGRKTFSTTGRQPIGPMLTHFIRGTFPKFSRNKVNVLKAVAVYLALHYLEDDSKEIKNAFLKTTRSKEKVLATMQILKNKYPELRQDTNRTTPLVLKKPPLRLPVKHRTVNFKILYDLLPDSEQNYKMNDGATIKDLKLMMSKLKGKLEGMNELSEMTSLGLQLAMDRLSKFKRTLQQMLKKISTTQGILTQNIK